MVLGSVGRGNCKKSRMLEFFTKIFGYVASAPLRDLVNFHVGSRKSGNWHFDGILLSKACRDLD